MIYRLEYQNRHFGPMKTRDYDDLDAAMNAARDNSLAHATVYKVENGHRHLVMSKMRSK